MGGGGFGGRLWAAALAAAGLAASLAAALWRRLCGGCVVAAGLVAAVLWRRLWWRGFAMGFVAVARYAMGELANAQETQRKEAAGELAAKAQRRVEHLERDGDEDDQAVWEAATLKVSAEGGLFRHDAAAS